MFSLFRKLLRPCDRILSLYILTKYKQTPSTIRWAIPGSGILFSVAVAQLKSNCKLAVEDPNRLTSGQLIRNASGATVDAALAMYTQAVNALLEVEELYTEAVKRLTALLELNLQVLGSKHQEDKVWEYILAVRSEIAQHLEKKQELEVMYRCAERVLSSAAEAAFHAGVEFSSSAGSERLSAGQLLIQRAQRLSDEARQDLLSIETKVIVETTKYAEEQKKENQKEVPTEPSSSQISEELDSDEFQDDSFQEFSEKHEES